MKYRFLGAVSTIYYFMAVTVSLIGVILGVFSITTTRNGIISGFIIIIGSLLTALSLAAFGQLIQLMIDLAENTAESARYLAALASRRRPAPPDQPVEHPLSALRELRSQGGSDGSVATDEIALTEKRTILKNRLRPDTLLGSDD
jgi:hypothetical protein